MIEIKISGNTTAEALAELTCLVGLANAAGIAKPKPQVESVSKSNTESEPSTEPVPEVPAEPEKAEQEKTADDEATTEPARAYTREEVRAETVAVAKKHGKQAVRDLLESLGAQGVSTLPPEKYPEFMQKLGEINAE